MKLAQKQINDEIWQLGLFFIIKEYGNRLFWGFSFANISMKTWYCSRLKLLKVATMILIFQLSRTTNVAAEHIWVSYIWKKKSPRVLTAAIPM